jgi:uncharacterized protein YkwD
MERPVMSDAPERSRLHFPRPRRFWLPLSAVAGLTLGVVTTAAMLVPVAAGHESLAPDPAPTATATAPVAANDASALAAFGLAPALPAGDGAAYADIAKFVAIAAMPTATPPPPPTPTAVPPTPVRRAPAAAVVIVPKAPAPPPPPPPPPPAPRAAPAASGLDTSAMTALEQALFNDTNSRRVANGLAPLTVNPMLVGLARIRSHDMADNNYFAHTSPVTGDTAFSLMDRYGVPYGWAGENLAKNNYPLDQCEGVAADALWNSPPHRENILGVHYTQMGVGFAEDATGMVYFTIIFDGPA